MSLLLLNVTLRGVSNKHCLLSLFSFDSVCVIVACWVNFRKCVDMNYNFLTAIYERDIGMHTVVMADKAGKATYHDFKVKIVYNNFLPEIPTFRQTTYMYIHCSWITVVHAHVNIFL